MAHEEVIFVLPESVASPVDVARLKREVERLTEFMGEAKIRKSDEAKLPAPTKLLSDVCEANGLNLLHQRDREQLNKALGIVKAQAPLLHFSFAADPSTSFMKKLVTWLRKEIHPYTLVTVGLQPSISAGCMVRTDNKYFDFSLRQHLHKERNLLIQKLTGTTVQSTESA